MLQCAAAANNNSIYKYKQQRKQEQEQQKERTKSKEKIVVSRHYLSSTESTSGKYLNIIIIIKKKNIGLPNIKQDHENGKMCKNAP